MDSGKGNDALWGGRFEASPEAFTQSFGASLDVDKRMWRSDITASKAHARMLGAQGIISAEDVDAIVAGLDAVAAKIESGEFVFDVNDEDIHMAVEAELTRMIGEAGGRLHTGRSRNDQVATDTRLHVKGVLEGIVDHIRKVQEALLKQAEDNFGVVMPGYTHMQRAQPVLFSHHMLAYFWMLERDVKRIRAAYDSADVLPLGSAALAGTTYPLDRRMVADELGFSAVSPNSLDAVSDRDFLLDAAYACSVGMIHLSRLCEELVYWSSGEFGFITMSDAYSTGSSIMPQKKNPDFAELIRGKSGRTVGDLVGLLVTMKSLPLAYNKDMQEDKEPAFDAIDTACACIHLFSGMLRTIRFNKEVMEKSAMRGFTNATDAADYLVGRGVPFRDAHGIIGRLVLHCLDCGKSIEELPLEELQTFSAYFGQDVYEAISLRACVNRRLTTGAPGEAAMEEELAASRTWLQAQN